MLRRLFFIGTPVRETPRPAGWRGDCDSTGGMTAAADAGEDAIPVKEDRIAPFSYYCSQFRIISMKLTRYGSDVLVVMTLLTIGLIIVGLFIDLIWLQALLVALAIVLGAFTLYFFRDPERNVPAGKGDEDIVISPADGKVVVVQDVIDEEYHKGPAKQISIFLSPLNVHVNRIPASGVVDYYRYVKGKYLVAFHDKASELNERTHIGISNGRIRILFKQIAGAVARRIVCEVKVGDEVHIGDRFGMIKFGSRMDIVVPPTMIVEVGLGDMVVAGETILCRLPND